MSVIRDTVQKVYAGVDAGSRYVHTITGTATNVHDVMQAHVLIEMTMKSAMEIQVSWC